MKTNRRICVALVVILTWAVCLTTACGQLTFSVSKVRLSTTGANDAGVYSVRTFGAKGDGKTLDTPAINRAIDAAAKAGGGTVFFPAGSYLSVSIRLKSNITL